MDFELQSTAHKPAQLSYTEIGVHICAWHLLVGLHCWQLAVLPKSFLVFLIKRYTTSLSPIILSTLGCELHRVEVHRLTTML